ncbi:hypothetical protein AVEN_242915-1 [Araneus ventricosus]|uniref:Uncharacterized protein n=1 Tax=Araneus ventricosus TaxID=182803 RepID=A0A4Y2TD58_ARAVE|nr:hypothetical protein AVEN_242915-1 [Araneus ventricosus]
MPIPRGCLPKSDFSWDFQSADHTAFFGTPEPEKQFETPNPFSLRPSLLEHPFYSLLQGVDEVLDPQIKKSYKEKINERKYPLTWSPGCTAFTHIYGSPLSERREHIKHLSIEEEHPFSNYWFTNFPPSIGESLVLFRHSGRIPLILVPSRMPKQEVYISRASLRVVFCTTPSITQNRREHGHALQNTIGIDPLEAWFNSRLRVIAARLHCSDEELKSQNVPSEAK